MKKSEELFRALKSNQLVALLAPRSAEECLTAYEIFQPNDINLEIAFRTEYAPEGIRLVVEKYPDALLLAGTVMTAQQAELAIEAGAAGIVSADYIPEVVDVCVKNDILCIPGGLSDVGKQLVRKAEGYGCSLEELSEKYPYQWIYKLFPAFYGKTANPGLASAWRGPYKNLTVVYTGGISLETLPEVVVSDPGGIFCASALTSDLDDPARVEEEIGRWKAMLHPEELPPAEPRLAEPEPADVSAEGRVPPAGMPRVITFGELMVRLSPPVGIRLRSATAFDVHFGGAAANVAVSLARFGFDASFVSLLPDSDMGDNAVATLRSHGVGMEHILRKGRRMGIYFLEHGSGPRPSKVVYDRAHSAFAEVAPAELDWDRILDGADWFHWTGITPALGEGPAAAIKDALEVAKKNNVTISADLNYRSRLWSEERARQVMSGLMPYVDLLIANEEDPEKVFGVKLPETDVEAGRLNLDGYREVAEKLMDMFDFNKVAITLRQSISASENDWTACLFDGKDFLLSPTYHVWIVDRVGAGDAFAAGLIYGILTGREDADALNFAVAASCLKHSIYGDFNLVDVAEVERLAAGQTGGRVQR